MNSELNLWLYTLVFISAFSLVLYFRMGISWTWGFFLQSTAMLALALTGLLTGKPFPYVAAGWTAFVLAVIVPRTILGRLERNLNLLSPDAAIAEAKRLRWFFWGPPGKYWLDMAESLALFMKGEAAGAEALIARWQKAKLPRQTRDGLFAYLLVGRTIMRDWQGIVNDFKEIRQVPGARITQVAATAACRAYLELGQIPEACLCLEIANLPAFRMNDVTREMSFLAFFSLTGGSEELSSVFQSLSGKRNALPEHARLYWQARCFSAQGNNGDARDMLDQALAAAPPAPSTWRQRITFQLERLSDAPDMVPAHDWTSEIARARTALERARLVAGIVSPGGRCLGVTAIVALIIAAYLISHGFQYLPGDGSRILAQYCFHYGVLYKPAIAAGELWRLITFLFLHAHISHIALNLVGLWWFGRMCEHIFGTGKFLAIYFLSGILSGLAECMWSPELMAIGASGAVMGVFGAATAAIFRLKDVLPASLRKSDLTWMLGLALAQVVLDQFVPHVAIYAHIGGLVAGFLLGLVLPIRKITLIESAKIKTPDPERTPAREVVD